jgi:hypothetical protein
MATNTLLTIDMITREALRIAHEKTKFIATTDRSYDDSFAKTGAKIGDTLRIRKPVRYVRRTNSRIMAVQDTIEESVALTVATQDGVDIAFTSAERALKLDDYSKRILEPAMAVLVSGIEADYLTAMTKATYNLVGTPGTVPNDLEIFANAQAKLNQYLAPEDDNRSLQVNSITMAKMVGANKGLFQDASQIKQQYREGIIGRTTMADWYANERTYRHTNGADVAGEVNMAGGVTEGATTVTVDGFTAAPTVGSVFTFELSKAVHPETKQAYSHLQQFTVTAATTTLITFQPAIYASGPRQNVTQLPADNDDIVFVGSASTTYAQDLMYHKEAYTFATADLPIMPGECSRKTYDGISLRVWSDGDIRNDEYLTRVDILYGFAALRPEWGVRITS